MNYIKIGENQYPAIITSTKAGGEWGGRAIKILTLEMDHGTASALFVDDIRWSSILPCAEVVDPETGEATTELVEYDCGDYCLAGPITDNRDGTVTVKMGKLTDGELLAIMMGGN